MNKHYPEFKKYTAEEINGVWEHGVIVLDTNILLNLYRYSEATRDGILPTLCYTKAVLKRITLDNLKELVDETLDGDITDVEYTTDDRLTDDDIRQYLRGHWHLEHPTDLQKKEKMERNEILIEAIQYGAPLRQLSRLTGISYGVIQRINGKMKVGQ